MSSARFLSACVLLALAAPSFGLAQSLAEAAAREKARREQINKRKVPSYTDADLPKAEPPKKAPTGDGATAAATPPPDAGTTPPVSETAAPANAGPVTPEVVAGKGEGEWRAEAQAVRNAVSEAESQLKAAEERKGQIDQLITGAVVQALEGDPKALTVLEAELKDATAAIEAAKKARPTAKAALEEFEARARQYGVPESWWAPPKSP